MDEKPRFAPEAQAKIDDAKARLRGEKLPAAHIVPQATVHVIECLTLNQQFRLIEIAHETEDERIMNAALALLGR